MKKESTGLLYGLGAYVIWGLLPLYWKETESAGTYEILSHRGIWSLLLCLILLIARKQIKSAIAMVATRRTLLLLFLSSGLLTINWGVYIWSVTVNRVVEAALGYYITPLINVTFGVLLLRERLRRLQWISVGFAALGVLVLTVGYGSLPWIAIALATTWGGYSVVKKRLNLGALETLTVETLFAFLPNFFYLIYLEMNHRATFGNSLGMSTLLAFSGIATVAPLLFFNGATTRLPLSSVGLLQYITPTIMLFIGVFINGEDLKATKLAGFVCIWIALGFLSRDLFKSSRTLNNSVA